MAFQLPAQSTIKPLKEGGGGFTLGYGQMDIRAFSPFIKNANLPSKSNQFILGITGNRKYDRFMTGLSASLLFGQKIKSDSLSLNFSGVNGTLDLGYLIVNKEKVKVFPMIGAGASLYGMKMKKIKDENATNTASDRPISIQNAGILFDFSMNVRFIPKRTYQPEKGHKSGFMTGLKMGYMYGLNNSIWRYTGGSITEGPHFGTRMFYVKLVLGGFGSSGLKP
jgi:hypothetical protein